MWAQMAASTAASATALAAAKASLAAAEEAAAAAAAAAMASTSVASTSAGALLPARTALLERLCQARLGPTQRPHSEQAVQVRF